MGNSTQKYTTLRDYIKVIFKHKAVMIITVVVLMANVYISVSLSTPVYSAKVLMLREGAKETEAEYYKSYDSRTARLNDIEIIKSSPVVEQTVKSLGLDNVPLNYEKEFASRIKRYMIDYRTGKFKLELDKLDAEVRKKKLFSIAVQRLKRNISAGQIQDMNMFEVRVADFSPNGAIVIANVLSRAYIIFDLKKQLIEIELKYGKRHSKTTQVRSKIEELSKYLDGRVLSNTEAIGPGGVKIIEQAKGVELLSKYNKSLILTLTFPLSLILGFLLCLGFEFLNQTITTPMDIENYLNLPFLGSIPKGKSNNKITSKDLEPDSIYAKFYQNLSDQLNLIVKDKNLSSILIADAQSSEDSAAVIANIGMNMARLRKKDKVLIIDANLRDYSVSEVFNISNNSGLTDVLEEKVSFEDAVKYIDSNLFVLTAGETELNPATLLDSSKMADFIKKVRGKYGLVLVTCADLINNMDAVFLSSMTDGFILIINEGRVRRQTAKFAINPLEQKKTNMIGAILNNRKLVIPKMIYDHI